MDMKELYESCAACKNCALADTRNNVVFGDGNPEAKIMLIGEGPGEQEDLSGIPFVGPAGKFLDKMLEIIYLDRSRLYIANMVKCRPPGNRDPLSMEKEACLPWLRAQTKIISPKIIICLGRVAAMGIISEDFKITKDHGSWTERNGVWMMASYHPSALLRDPSRRPEAFLDLKSLEKKIREVCPETYS